MQQGTRKKNTWRSGKNVRPAQRKLRRDVGNVLVVGGTGPGKTTFLSMMMLSMLARADGNDPAPSDGTTA